MVGPLRATHGPLGSCPTMVGQSSAKASLVIKKDGTLFLLTNRVCLLKQKQDAS